MKWIKKGLIYIPSGELCWSKTHAQIPVADVINENEWRIYYATRDENNISRISFLNVKAGNPGQILYIHNKPILDLGHPGSFDDSGLMPSCIVTNGNLKYLYYIGWNARMTVPYHNAIGVVVSTDGGISFNRLSEGPIIDRTFYEPYFTGTSFILKDDKIWKMWYMSCTKWEFLNGKFEPYYHIKYSESKDGINWIREGKIAIDYADSEEGGIASASVLKLEEGYEMWYCYRKGMKYRTEKTSSYRIGYANSFDGKIWHRKDHEAGINISEDGWDSQMIAYPNVIIWRDQKYMFYNGNGFGTSGFGYAVMENQ